jgi:hypothetical protein
MECEKFDIVMMVLMAAFAGYKAVDLLDPCGCRGKEEE